ncbi:hypothetical protein CgS9114_12322 [Corynebacterium glutamicum S9114]|nr:hypothetical protein CgS9114_12322 [Corynebacterium glutamicum S9114]
MHKVMALSVHKVMTLSVYNPLTQNIWKPNQVTEILENCQWLAIWDGV